MKLLDEMVSRFLGWRLPDDFYPDCGISFDGRKDDEWNKNKTWPTGTNLLTADQARKMLEHVLGVGEEGMTREWCAAFPSSAAGIINHLAQRIDDLEAASPPVVQPEAVPHSAAAAQPVALTDERVETFVAQYNDVYCDQRKAGCAGGDAERKAMREVLTLALGALATTLAAHPVARVIRSSAGQISMQAANGGPFDMSQFVGCAFYASPPAAPEPPAAKFKAGDLVRKVKGSQWHGRIVGTYRTELTPEGYAVESATEKGSVQIYPASALEVWNGASNA